MLKKSNLITSAVILIWYVIGAASGWKGWAPKPNVGAYGAGGPSGGHGSFYSGGWGGGK